MEVSKALTLPFVLLSFAVTACASTPTSTPTAADKAADKVAATASTHAEEAAPACPLEDTANEVVIEDVPGGVALLVTTKGDAAALRAQMVARMAFKKAHSKGDSPTTSTLEDIPGGFKRLIIAKDPAAVDKLRKGLRAHIAEERAEASQAPTAMPACAADVPGTEVKVYDVEGGLAADLVTTGDVAEVRSRLRARAAFMKAHPKPMPVKATKSLEDIEGGIRMTFTAKDPAQVDEVRTFFRARLKKAHGGK